MKQGRSWGYWAIVSQVALVAVACGDDGEPDPGASGGRGGDAGAIGDAGSDTGGQGRGGSPTEAAGAGGDASPNSSSGGGGGDGPVTSAGSAGEAGDPSAGLGGAGSQPVANPCAPSPCKNGATCARELDDFVCSCPLGYSGAICDVNIDDCLPAPCQNEGACTDGVDGRTCTCPTGFSGDDCETSVTGCEDDPCKNGATCTDVGGSYTCACPSGFYGPNCDTGCPQAHCLGSVTCNPTDGRQSRCQLCEPGYQGPICNSEIDECQVEPCQNDGICSDLLADFSCQCATGWTGKDCSADVDECELELDDCVEPLVCSNSAGGFECACRVGFSLFEGECFPNSCALQKLTFADSNSGLYYIDPDGPGLNQPLEVSCDMKTDDGVGYTYYRIDAPQTLLVAQTDYREACAAVGMEVIVPRTPAHYQAITAWNGGEMPNLVNVFPMVDYTAGLDNWIGRCQGRDCSFYLSDSNNVDCIGGPEPSGNENTTNEALYRYPGTGCEPIGRWNDGRDAVLIRGWVLCSTNDGGPRRTCQDLAILAASAGVSLEDNFILIDPDGPGGADSRTAWCDMTFEGGGWTLVLSSGGLGPDDLDESGNLAVAPGSSTYFEAELTGLLAQLSRSVHIRTQGDVTRSITSVAPRLIANLRQGLSLEYGTSVSDWEGPFANPTYLGQSGCSTNKFYPEVFDGCGMTGALQLVDDFSHWTADDGPEPLEVYVR